MAIKNKDQEWVCSYCGTKYDQATDADTCRESHNLILVALTKEDINHLIQFIYTQDDSLLNEGLVKRLQKYARLKNP